MLFERIYLAQRAPNLVMSYVFIFTLVHLPFTPFYVNTIKVLLYTQIV